ncbi:MAG: hypothetical protein Q9202_003379 [Teloschistes flavicans]
MAPKVPPNGFRGDLNDEIVGVKLCDDEDCATAGNTWSSFPDALYRKDRIEIGKCVTAGDQLRKEGVSAYTVTGGCCVFYSDTKCLASLFAANYREGQNLKGGSQDAIQSFQCNHKECEGLTYGKEDAIKSNPGLVQIQKDPTSGGGGKGKPELVTSGTDTKDMKPIEVGKKPGSKPMAAAPKPKLPTV